MNHKFASLGIPNDSDSAQNALDDSVGNATLIGTNGVDSLTGGLGNDVIVGGGGDDIHLSGGAGNDSIYGNPGSDVLDGGDGDDLLFGGAGDDSMEGGIGDDIVKFMGGTDTAQGGAGADTFAMIYGGGYGNHRTMDYSATAGDRIHIENGVNSISLTSDGANAHLWESVSNNLILTLEGVGSTNDVIIGNFGI
ncbi:MAG: calcium-binding protein [Sneathiellaceae bacterium]